MKEYEKTSKIEEMITQAIEKMKVLAEANTIVGEKIELAPGITIIPISKLCMGYVVGGGEYSDNSSRRVATHYPMAGGSSGGISVNPIGFLVDDGKEIKFIDAQAKNSLQNLINLVQNMIEKLVK